MKLAPWFFFQWFLPLMQILVGITIIVMMQRQPTQNAQLPTSPAIAPIAQNLSSTIPAEQRSILSLFDDVVLGLFSVGLIGSSFAGRFVQFGQNTNHTDYLWALITLIVVTLFSSVLVAMSLLVPADKIRVGFFVLFQLILLVPSGICAWRIRT
jgi:hypothetical protein